VRGAGTGWLMAESFAQAKDPLNLIQVMLAKGSVSIVCAYPGFSAAVLTYDRDAELV